MEEQTKIGTGAAAGIALMALLEPHFFEPYPKITAAIYIVLIAVTIWGFAPPFLRFARELSRRFRTMWPQYLMVLAGILFFIGLVAFLQMSATTSKEPVADTRSEEQANPLDRTVSFNCYGGSRPTHLREDRRLHVVEIVRPADPSRTNLAIGNTYFGQGTDEIKWGEDFPTAFYKCILTNHGSAPLFRVSVELTAYWLETLPTENGTSSGDVFATATVSSPTLDLGVSSKNEDFFYIVNMSECYVRLSFPETASVFRATDVSTPQKIKLISPNTMEPMISLFPSPIKTHPGPKIQVFEPPSTLEKK